MSNRDGNWEIYRARRDGSGLTRLTRHPGQDVEPAWSPDGSRIAFVRDVGAGNPEIHVMDADGRGTVRITRSIGEDLSPAWSPDGSLIAFTSDNEGEKVSTISYTGARRSDWLQQLFVARPDGTGLRRLLASGSVSFEQPTWSPDGTRIAVVAYHFHSVRSGIWTVDVRTGTVRKLWERGAFVREPAWSPDGRRIAYRLDHRGSTQVHVFDLDTWRSRQLTSGPGTAVRPAWSRDGTRVVFTRDLDGPTYLNGGAAAGVECAALRPGINPEVVDLCLTGPLPSELWSVGADGRGARQLFRHPADAVDAAP